MSSLCHAGTRVGLCGSATWPCVPRRIHVGPRKSYPLFCPFLIGFNAFKIKNKFK